MLVQLLQLASQPIEPPFTRNDGVALFWRTIRDFAMAQINKRSTWPKAH